MRLRAIIALSCLLFCTSAFAQGQSPARPDLDVTASRRPLPAVRASLEALRNSAAFRRIGTAAHIDERFGVPSFVWATRSAGGTTRPGGRPGGEQAARDHMARFAPYYRLDSEDARGAKLKSLHDTGRGGIIATFTQTVDGVDVFRDEMKVLMDRNLDLVAISGYIPGRAEAGKASSRVFRLQISEGIGRALEDFAGIAIDRGAIRGKGPTPGGYEWFELALGGRPLSKGLVDGQEIRGRKVLFHLPDRLEPATYVEIMTEEEAVSYVVSAVDGSILFRRNLMASDSYTYRVWADNTLKAPFDGPQGNAPTPHPTGLNDLYGPPFVPSALISLQNGPISTNDPWLPTGATVTNGNNVDAYADLSAPDGLTGSDFRASTNGPNTFDYTYDVNAHPNTSSTQRLAAITQLFYDVNFFHDWYYDAGFDEASGNAQTSNYGRGGLQNDNIRAEAQDYGNFNNANMVTPADGARPRMQMYVFNVPGYRVTVNTPAGIAGPKPASGAFFGLSNFNVTADVVLVNDGVGTTSDGCEPILNSVAGKIALIDRGNCDFPIKVCAAQAAGAVGVIIANNVAQDLFQMGGTPACTVTIPVLMISLADGNAIKNALLSGPVNVTMFRGSALSRDGTLDNQMVAHEWGHYISNRLIGDAAGLSNSQGQGMGEGWGDFHALLMTVKPEDASVPSNPNFSGVYALCGYVNSSSITPTNTYYYGIRRYPYSTDFAKNPLTFRHIQEGVPLPAGPPVAYGANGVGNTEVHATGEVWCQMLWECYAELLRATGRLTFDQARDRMREYLVAAYKMTPNAPTFLEARDALLSAAYAADPADFQAFCAAFARRGAGVGAVGPDRNSTDHLGVTESYLCGGDLALVSVTLDDAVHGCDSDGYLDDGEVGYLTVTLKNAGGSSLSSTTATLSSSNPTVIFQGGTTLSFPATAPFATTTASTFVRCSGASGIQVDDIQIQYDDPGLAVAGPRNGLFETRGNTDEAPAGNETVEARVPTWSMSGPVLSGVVEPWRRERATAINHRFYGPDPGGYSDQHLVSPPLQVPAGSFSFTFQHAYSFETSGGTFWDGGVVEVSQNGGASWTDIGASISPGYGGTLSNASGNPLGGRSAFVGQSAGFPTLNTATVNLGSTYSNKTILLRFRLGADANTGGPGWLVDNLVFSGLTNTPFLGVIADPGPCTPVAVEESAPNELAFALTGAHPITDRASFRFALPRATAVRLTVHDVSGRRVATVAEGTYDAGIHAVSWEPGSNGPKAGVYFARLTAEGKEFHRRLIVLSR